MLLLNLDNKVSFVEKMKIVLIKNVFLQVPKKGLNA